MTVSTHARTSARLVIAIALLLLLSLPVFAQATDMPTATPTATDTPTATFTPTFAPAVSFTLSDMCSFREAIRAANENKMVSNCSAGSPDEHDTIVLSADVRLTDFNVEAKTHPIIFEVTENITIDGNKRKFIGHGSHGFVFNVATGKSLTIRNASFHNAVSGSAWGTVTVEVNKSESFTGTVNFEQVDFINENTGCAETCGVSLVVHRGKATHRIGWFHRNKGIKSVEVKNAGSIDIYRASFHENTGGTGAGYVLSLNNASTLRSSTVGKNSGGNYAVSGGNLRNVTVARNTSEGVTGAASIKNSILWGNKTHDCKDSSLIGYNWVDNALGTQCSGGTRRISRGDPDIDDDLEYGWFKLEDGADAIDKGANCEFLDQRGNPFGDTPCDLGAYSSHDASSARRAGPGPARPTATRGPYSSPTPTQGRPPPTPTPMPRGWVLLSEQETIKRNEVDAAGVGIAHIVEMGFLEAVDIWSEVGWGVTVCHTEYSSGSWVFLDAAGMPRQAVPWPAAPHINGWACTFIETPGTLVLLRADPWSEPPTPTQDPAAPNLGPPTPFALENCQLITRDMVNLRAEEWGDVLDIIPYETELSASESTEEFYKVVFEEQEGYVHKDWVFIVSGVCLAPVEVEE